MTLHLRKKCCRSRQDNNLTKFKGFGEVNTIKFWHGVTSTARCSHFRLFPENKLPREDRTSSFLTYGEAGKRVLKFQANFSEVFEVLSSNDGSNFIQIRLLVSNLSLNIIP